nr:hypothetical protein [Tanacetum cinerariifolium]
MMKLEKSIRVSRSSLKDKRESACFAISNGARADSSSPPSLRLLDPRSDPAEGPSGSSSSSHQQQLHMRFMRNETTWSHGAASAKGFVCLYSEKLASNDFNLSLKRNTESKVGFCRTSLGIGVGGIGGWLAVVMVVMMDGVIVGIGVGRGATKDEAAVK